MGTGSRYGPFGISEVNPATARTPSVALSGLVSGYPALLRPPSAA